MPSIVCIWAFVPSTSNMRGTMSIWRSMSCTERMTRSVWSCESVEKAIATRCAPYSSTSAGRSSVVPMNGIFPLVAAMRSSRSTKPDDPQSVLGVFLDLLGEQARHVPGADDDDVLDVRRLTAADRPDDGAHDRHEGDRKEPEDDEPPKVRMREPGEVRQNEEAPGSERDDLNDPDDVVHGGVIRALLVPVVQPVDAREQNPERDGGDEENDLPDRSRRDRRMRRAPRARRRRRTTSPARRRRRASEQTAHQPPAAPTLRPGCIDLMEPRIALCDGDRVLDTALKPRPPPDSWPRTCMLGPFP